MISNQLDSSSWQTAGTITFFDTRACNLCLGRTEIKPLNIEKEFGCLQALRGADGMGRWKYWLNGGVNYGQHELAMLIQTNIEMIFLLNNI